MKKNGGKERITVSGKAAKRAKLRREPLAGILLIAALFVLNSIVAAGVLSPRKYRVVQGEPAEENDHGVSCGGGHRGDGGAAAHREKQRLSGVYARQGACRVAHPAKRGLF